MYSSLSSRIVGTPRTLQIIAGTTPIEVRTIVEETTVSSRSGATATLMTTTHLRVDSGGTGATRPVLFAFNGGPGAASGFLNVGVLGPRRLDIGDIFRPRMQPPFAMQDNDDSPLDLADVVLIDPPGTGLSTISESASPEDFYGPAQDAETIIATILSWCERHGRENSPRFLLGESYGASRAISILLIGTGGPFEGGTLTGLGFNGAILMGSSAHLARVSTGDLQFALDVSGMAATAWYHGAVDTTVSLADHVARAGAFGRDVLPALLHKGAAVSHDELRDAAETLANLTGLPVDLVLQRRLRVDAETFANVLLASRGVRVGKYDSRYTSALAPTKNEPIADDPAMGRYSHAFVYAARSQLRELGVEGAENYRLIEWTDVNFAWNWGGGFTQFPDSVGDLAVVMTRDPHLRLFFAAGLFDLVTTPGAAEYASDHATADPGRSQVITYESGHMVFLGDDARRAFVSDLRRFVTVESTAGASPHGTSER